MSKNSTLSRATRRYKGRSRLAMLTVLLLGTGVSALSGLGANEPSAQVGQPSKLEPAPPGNKTVNPQIDHGIQPASIPVTIQSHAVDTNEPVLRFDRIVEVSGDSSNGVRRLVL